MLLGSIMLVFGPVFVSQPLPEAAGVASEEVRLEHFMHLPCSLTVRAGFWRWERLSEGSCVVVVFCVRAPVT